MLSNNQRTIIRKLLTWLVGGLAALLLLGLMLFYRAELGETQAQLQEVTNQLTKQAEEHDRFVREQELLQSILAAGQIQKQQSEVYIREAIKKQHEEGTAVRVTGVSLDLLQQASRKVRENAIGATVKPD